MRLSSTKGAHVDLSRRLAGNSGCLRRRSRATTWVEQDRAKPLPLFSFPCGKAKNEAQLRPRRYLSYACRSYPFRHRRPHLADHFAQSLRLLISFAVVAGKFRRASANKHRRGLRLRAIKPSIMRRDALRSEPVTFFDLSCFSQPHQKCFKPLAKPSSRAKPTCPGVPWRDLQCAIRGAPHLPVLQPLFLLSSQEPVTFFDLSVFFAAPPDVLQPPTKTVILSEAPHTSFA
jgi:hypothetical protein